MIAWDNDQELKISTIAKLRQEENRDKLLQKVYCEIGLLPEIVYWIDVVSDGLGDKRGKQFIISALESIPVGADMSKCKHHLASWLLSGDAGILPEDEIDKDYMRLSLEYHKQSLFGKFDKDTIEFTRSRANIEARAALSEARATWLRSESESDSRAAWISRIAARSALLSTSELRQAAISWSLKDAVLLLPEEKQISEWNNIAVRSFEIFANAPVPNSEEDYQKFTHITINDSLGNEAE